MTKYLCEGIFLAGSASSQASGKYSGYEKCVESNFHGDGDGFFILKRALGYCDKEFGIADR